MQLDEIVIEYNGLINLKAARKKKAKKEHGEVGTAYEKGNYVIKSIEEGGKVVLVKKGTNIERITLLEYPSYRHLRAGMELYCMLSRKIFYVYWEIMYIDRLREQGASK